MQGNVPYFAEAGVQNKFSAFFVYFSGRGYRYTTECSPFEFLPFRERLYGGDYLFYVPFFESNVVDGRRRKNVAPKIRSTQNYLPAREIHCHDVAVVRVNREVYPAPALGIAFAVDHVFRNEVVHDVGYRRVAEFELPREIRIALRLFAQKFNDTVLIFSS